MRHAVYGIVSTSEQASVVVRNLREAGFTRDDISVLLPDKKGTRDFAHDPVQLRAGLTDRDGGFQPRDHFAAKAAAAQRAFPGIVSGRTEELRHLRRIAHAEWVEIRGQYSDHAVRLPAELKHAADNARIGAEAMRPESVTEDDDVRARPPILLRNECATGPRGINLCELSAEEQDLR